MRVSENFKNNIKLKALISGMILITVMLSLPIAQTETPGVMPHASDWLPPTDWSNDVLLIGPTSNTSLLDSGWPRITVNNDVIHMLWQQYFKSEEWPDYLAPAEVLYMRSLNGGLAFEDGLGNVGAFRKINTEENGDYMLGLPAMTVNGSKVHALYMFAPRAPEGYAKINSAKLIYRGSSDNGATWDDEIVLHKENGNPAIHEDIHGFDLAVSNRNVYAFFNLGLGPTAHSYGDIYFSKSPDEGKSWSHKRQLTFENNSGSFLLAAYGSAVYMLDGYKFMRSLDYGETWDDGLGNIGVGRSIISEPYMTPSSMIAEEDGVFIAMWKEIPNWNWWEGELVYMPYYQIKFMYSLDKGFTWSDPQILVDHSDVPYNIYCNGLKNLTSPCGHYADTPQLAVDSNNVYIVWQDLRLEKGNLEIFFKSSKDRGITWSDDIRLTNASSPSVQPRIAYDKVGKVLHVVWMDYRHSPNYPYERVSDLYYKRYPDFSLVPVAPTNLSAELSSDLKDIVITWNLSIDDPNVGIGANNVVAYDIYYSTTYDPYEYGYSYLGSVPAGTNTYFHENIAGDGNSYFYYIGAVNNNSFRKVSTEQAAKFTRYLNKGANLISVPLIPNDNTPGTVLQTLSYNSAWYYDPWANSEPWKLYNPNKPHNDLPAIDYSMGIFVNVKAEGFFTVAGKVPTEVKINLKSGWNLVGYPSLISRKVGDALSKIPCERIEGYADIPPQYLKLYTDSEFMMPGYGYWVKIDGNALWTLRN